MTVEPGSDLDGETVAGLEESGERRVLLLDGARGQRWRPPVETTLTAGDEVTVVAIRQGLPQLLAAREGEAAREPAKPQAGP
ncbi:MAG: TrkA C-terminal domain-containing protein [Thermoleophilaceae bacterium]|nr:TrkA C-terminal domain-containing protein [Thermoleophilaceae bacterium]